MALSLPDLIRVTTQSLCSNPVRSGLTTLGVFMGVAAVNATLQVGNISNAITQQRLSEREAPQVSFWMWVEEGRQPRVSDLALLRQRLQDWESMSASSYSIADKVIFRGEALEASVEPVLREFLLTSGRKLIQGRFLNEADMKGFRRVIVVDEFMQEQLFKTESALGQDLVVNGNIYQVVGIMEQKQSGWGDLRGFAVVPLSTASAVTGVQGINQISIRAKNLDSLIPLQEEAESFLTQQFPGANIYGYNNVEEILQQKQIWDLATKGLTGVGLISLLISGVGIANITIAAVIERTSEIGLRRAIGATRREVLTQFILEAVILSLVGGGGAIATVHGLTSLVSQSFDLPYKFETRTAAFSLGSAVLVGVGACFVPALRASRLDPVKALREA